MPHLLGYARVSTADQNPDLQLDALNGIGCYRLFVDTASGALDERPELARVLDQVHKRVPSLVQPRFELCSAVVGRAIAFERAERSQQLRLPCPTGVMLEEPAEGVQQTETAIGR